MRTLSAAAELSWTSVEGEEDQSGFTAWDGTLMVGRIFRHAGWPLDTMWIWTMSAFGSRICLDGVSCTGIVRTKEEAARCLSHCYAKCARGRRGAREPIVDMPTDRC